MKFFENPTLWQKPDTLKARLYCCGFCSAHVSAEKGMQSYHSNTGAHNFFIYLCPYCNGPTFMTDQGDQHPPPVFGNPVSNVPNDLKKLYDEARRCTGQHCYTSSVLACRKILMNISVSQGAKEGLKFIEYVNYLSEKNFIPPNGKHWVDYIRKKGNEATHVIALMEAKDARDLLIFIEMLLKFIYEFPSMIDKTAEVVD